MKIVVDYDKCTSNAVCMGIAPEVFEVRDDNFLYVLQEEPAARSCGPKVEEAVRMCPTQAISHRGVDPPDTSSVDTIVSSARRSRGCGRSRPCAARGSTGRLVARRRRAAPALRPAAALEGAARGGVGARPDRASPAARTTSSISSCGSGSRRRRSISTRRRSSSPSGTELAFDGLVIATGATPRTAARRSPTLEGVFTLRTLDDCHAIRTRLDAGARVVRHRRGLHRLRGRGDLSQARASRSPCSKRCRNRWCAASARCSARSSAVCTASRASTCARCRRRGDRRRRSGRAGPARRRRARSTATWCSSRSVSEPETRWLEGSGLVLDDGVVCDETLLAAPGRRRGG